MTDKFLVHIAALEDEVTRLRAHIRLLQGALREIKDQLLTSDQASAIASKALREENSDVGPGFRGNNDYA